MLENIEDEKKYVEEMEHNNASHARWKQQLTCLRVIIANDKNVDDFFLSFCRRLNEMKDVMERMHGEFY